ncbi:hypothetical protein [Phenylobacterium sp.]|uniref:hypothetical protein n=1 Tax=Phenylobacterium sp. TaxID=1871053 RepID=UPI003567E7D2
MSDLSFLELASMRLVQLVDAGKIPPELVEAEMAWLQAQVENLTYQMIGRATQTWASLEIALDLVNSCLSRAMLDRGVFPLALGRKVELFKRSHRQLPPLAPYLEEATSIADEILRLSVTRHDMIHGYAHDGFPGDTSAMHRHTVSRDPAERHLLKRETITRGRSEFFDLVFEIKALGQRLVDHFGLIMPLLTQHYGDNLSS